MYQSKFSGKIKYSEESSVLRLLRGSLLLVPIQFWGWGEGGRLLTFSAFRMGTYSRWVLTRGWALIPINA